MQTQASTLVDECIINKYPSNTKKQAFNNQSLDKIRFYSVDECSLIKNSCQCL